MELIDIANFIARSTHVVAGIAWIGASFYFVMLDSSLKSPRDPQDVDHGVAGELWAVHGGGMYNSKKYLAGPVGQPLPSDLHWSKWEAYTTWISGMALLAIIYWARADIYLLDPSVADLTSQQAILVSIAYLVGFWLIYDQLCKRLSGAHAGVFVAILFIIVCALAWGVCMTFGGRGAFIIFGACLGTAMAANVFFVIIPGQKKMLAAIEQGEQPDPLLGINGKMRSVHNTYFTLPVLFCMLVNHYAAFYSHSANWLILIAVCLAGVLIRLFFVSRHGADKPDYKMALFGLLFLSLSLVAVYLPAHAPQTSTKTSQAQAIDFSQVQSIVLERCTVCHASSPSYAGFTAPPKGVVYETADDIRKQAEAIYQQSVVLKAMPIANLTKMTDAERAQLANWFVQFQASDQMP